jgi:hypothetical protein
MLGLFKVKIDYKFDIIIILWSEICEIIYYFFIFYFDNDGPVIYYNDDFKLYVVSFDCLLRA